MSQYSVSPSREGKEEEEPLWQDTLVLSQACLAATLLIRTNNMPQRGAENQTPPTQSAEAI